jgi:hypothetical protein
MGQLDRVRAEISGDPSPLAEADGEAYRLIVQSYDSKSVGADHRPAPHARPRASTQRAITVEELRNGVEVDVVQVGGDTAASSIVVAWIERGAPDLELDALTARPAPDAFYGSGAQVTESARVVLRRSA